MSSHETTLKMIVSSDEKKPKLRLKKKETLKEMTEDKPILRIKFPPRVNPKGKFA